MGCAHCFFSVAGLLRSKFRQAGDGEENSLRSSGLQSQVKPAKPLMPQKIHTPPLGLGCACRRPETTNRRWSLAGTVAGLVAV